MNLSRCYKVASKKPLPGGETTELQLITTIRTTIPTRKPIPGFDPNLNDLHCFYAQKGVDCDEVYPGIYLGDGHTAKNKKYLTSLNITHVLNAAEGERFGFVNTGKHFYADTTIKYLGLPVDDIPTVNISRYFHQVATFIDEAISAGGRIFVHCRMGVSRSATCVLAYLMLKKSMLAVDAMQLVCSNRSIYPNDGFLRQLVQLDNHLRRQRL